MTTSKTTRKWLIQNIRRRLPALALLTLCSVGSALCGVFFALGTKGVIDAAIAKNKELFLHNCLLQAVIIAGILIFHTLSMYLKERTHAVLDKEWKKTILHDLLSSEYRSVSEYHSSELINRLNNDIRILDDAIVNLIPNLSSMISKLCAAFIVLSTLTPFFALAMLGAGLFVILLTSILRKHLKELHKRLSEANGRVSGIMQETLEKLLAVQAMDIADEVEKRTKIRLNERFAIHCKSRNISLFTNTCVYVMFYGAGFVALVYCAFSLLNGTMSYGTLSAVTQLVNQIQSPLMGISGIIPQYISATAAAERLMELTELPKNVKPLVQPALDIYESVDGISCKDLVFSYGRDCILDHADFYLPKGSFCVVTGPSGVGKSTLLKLLLGIYTPEQGGLYFNCQDRDIPIDGSTRKLFDYVPQGNLLFSGTIRDNLLVVKPDATEDEINQAVYVSVMDTFLPQLPNGLDTVLGESGEGLSEGQAQRLAIARAILGGSPILLLDECTSALDVDTETAVLQRIRNLRDKTCIAVTHRLIAKSVCNCFIQINNGKINIEHVD